MQVVEAEGLVKQYDGVRALDGATFTVSEGDLFALVGPNGAGKTTLMRMMTDILRPDQGTLRLFGKDRIADALSYIGYMPEERGLYKAITGLETVAYFAQLKGMNLKESRDAAMEALARVGMEEHGKRKLEELSKGMAQRVQFAATIAHNPRLLILDEPFSGLDPVSSRFLQDVITRAKSEGRTIILSTHNLEHAERLCNRLLMLHRGKVRLYGGVAEIKERFTTRAYFLEYTGELPEWPDITVRRSEPGRATLEPQGEVDRGEMLHRLVKANVDVIEFSPVTPSLEDIFIQVAGEEGAQALRETRAAAAA